MNTERDPNSPENWALWRYGVLGPLVSARLGHGDRQRLFAEAAQRTYERPDGRVVRLSPRTLEDWYYAYVKGGWKALMPRSRTDRCTCRAIRPDLVEKLLAAKRHKPRRSVNMLIRAFERAGWALKDELKRSTVHRLLEAHALSLRPPRTHAFERRSFLPEHAGDLWVGDAMHGPLVRHEDGREGKAYLISILDAATRYVVSSRFCANEGALSHENVLRGAILRFGLPRVYYVDLGAAYVADSLKVICADLGIQLIHTKARDPEAKGCIERWHRTLREQLVDELSPGPHSLQGLNSVLWAWLEREYHARTHSTTERAPGLHIESELDHFIPVPKDIDLRDVFLHRATRRVHKDGCVRFQAAYYEVPGDLVGERVELRYDPRVPEDRPLVFHRGKYRDVATLLNRVANAFARRKALPALAPAEGLEIDVLAQLEAAHYRTVFGAMSDDGNDGGHDDDDERHDDDDDDDDGGAL
jgi:putative transposase